MKKISNKGFTLIELIIAISIFSVVILIGYRIINGINKSVHENQTVHESQLSINIINKYLTNDLEKSKNIVSDYSKQDSKGVYTYIIETSNFNENNSVINYVKYDVNLTSNTSYSVTRKVYAQNPNINLDDIKGEVTIIENQKIANSNRTPFTIVKSADGVDEEGNVEYKNKYEVYIESSSSKTYSFDVASRIIEGLEINEENTDVKPPGIKPDPPEGISPSGGLGYMGFWVADPEKKSNDNLYVWMNSKKNDEIFDKYGTQENIESGVTISGTAMPGNSSGGDNANIGEDTNLIIDKEDKENFPNIGHSKFSVYVSEGIEFENEGISGWANKVVCNHDLEGLVNHYHTEMKTNNNISITGNMKLKSGYDSGYIIIIYGS